MTVPADEIAGELYLVPPARFVAARDELVRKAREAGNRELPMEGLSALGRQLRHAQTRLDGTQLRRLSAQRQQMIADLLDRARRRAAEAGLKPTDGVLSEVEATLQAALVDLAASSTVLSGRLVRPMSHIGFGPMPHVDAPAPAPLSPPSPPPPLSPSASGSEGRIQEAQPEWSFWPVEDKHPPQLERAAPEQGESQHVERGGPRSLEDHRQQRQPAAEAPPTATGAEGVRRSGSKSSLMPRRPWRRPATGCTGSINNGWRRDATR